MTTWHWRLLCNVHQFNGAAVRDIVLHASRADNSLCHSPEPPLPPDAGRHQIRRSSHQRASPTEMGPLPTALPPPTSFITATLCRFKTSTQLPSSNTAVSMRNSTSEVDICADSCRQAKITSCCSFTSTRPVRTASTVSFRAAMR